MSTIFINPYLGGANWWEAGGATGAIAVYQPKGAASLAASYINLANPGTNNAAPGIAPTLGVNGWTFNGTNQYLTTGITPAVAWTMLIRFSGAAANQQVLAGQFDDLGAFMIALGHVAASGGVLFVNGQATSLAGQLPNLLSGVVGIAGKNGYRNGVFDIAIPGIGGVYSPLAIAARFNNGAIGAYYNGNIQAFVVYNNTLDAAQVAAVSAAMAAL